MRAKSIAILLILLPVALIGSFVAYRMRGVEAGSYSFADIKLELRIVPSSWYAIGLTNSEPSDSYIVICAYRNNKIISVHREFAESHIPKLVRVELLPPAEDATDRVKLFIEGGGAFSATCERKKDGSVCWNPK
jgi:hypothetical protein